MASSSSAPSIRKRFFKYDVFLSFRGEDTRKNFVDHLYHALQQKGINTYKDDEKINKGKRISDELITSIQDSKIFIVVFSENYASSSWCLDELVNIMECQKTKEQTAYPVFYDVQPNDVRKQSGAFGEAFVKNKEEEGAWKWREALTQATNLAGWDLKTTLNGHEAPFIQEIVEKISLELRVVNFCVDEKLVGMEIRVKVVVSSLEIDIDDVRLIGIKGMGGGGKTTLARVVFDQISDQFEGSSFVENVREASKNPLSGLKSLQKQVLSEVLKKKDIDVTGVFEGKKMMKKMICGIKVLVVLDDVDHIDQLQALAGESNWFKPGSRIIITTRDEQVLVTHEVPKNLIVDVNLLSPEEASCLFNKYAFGRVIPDQGYDMLSNQVVNYAAGLPLTIKVLGSFLCGKNEREWKDALERLKTIPLQDTLEILELSYESLKKEEKKIFLDVACILKGWNKEDAIRVLECHGFHAAIGLKVLEEKSLITLSYSGCLGMHDHIEEMGKDIVRRLHPDDPSRHSRLWIEEEVKDILVENKGNEDIRCIIVRDVHPNIIMKGLRKMQKLRFLEVAFCPDDNGMCFPFKKDSLYLPDSLQYLHWNGYPLTRLPKTFHANNLVGIVLHFRNTGQHWKWKLGEGKVLKKLRFIEIYYGMLKSLDIRLIPNLERLWLVKCHYLKELHMPVESLALKHLTLHSSMLNTLNIRGAPNLEMLDLEQCKDLVAFHMPIECSKLKTIKISLPKLRTLKLIGYSNLERLDLKQCNDLVELHMPIECSKLKTIKISLPKLRTLKLIGYCNLERLDLEKCNDLVELHMPIECCKLKIINMALPKLRALKLIGSCNLEWLHIRQCYDLVELHMPIECPKLKTVKISFSKLRILELTGNPNIERLDIKHCKSLVEPDIFNESLFLKTIDTPHSKLRTFNFTGLRNLERLDLKKCENLVELHMPIISLKLKSIKIYTSKLTTLKLTRSPNLELTQYDHFVALHMHAKSPQLQSTIAHGYKLRTLHLTTLSRNFKQLDLNQCEIELHRPIESPELKSINICCYELRTLNLSGSWNLERLELEKCENLVELDMPIESPNLKTIIIPCSKLRTLDLTGFWNLEQLDLKQCEDLIEVHMPIKSLKFKSIKIGCSKLKTLNLTGYRNLEELDLEQCEDLVELHMPIESPKLKSIKICCSKLKTLNLTRYRNLQDLDLERCKDLIKLQMRPESPHLKNIIIRNCSELRTLHLGLSRSLERLDLHDCFNLVKIHVVIGCLSGSVRLNLFSVNQGFPVSSSFDDLHLVARPLGICSLHPENSLPKFHFECIYKELLLSSTRNLAELITNFGICACTNLASLSRIVCGLKHLRRLKLEGSIPEVPKELDQLECLEELTLLSTSIEHLPDSICMLKYLKVLRIKSCWFLKQLPGDLGKLDCLEELCLTDCTSLQDIPNSICEMKLLKCFRLINCILVERLPKGLGRLKCLKELNIEGTGISDMPESIFEMEDLRFFL